MAFYNDVDLIDTHTYMPHLTSATLSSGGPISPALNAALMAALSTLELDSATGDGSGQYEWDFALDNSLVQPLAQGETLEAVYSIDVTDNHLESATQQVTINITGTNDQPVIGGTPNIVVAAGADAFALPIPEPTDIDGDALTVTVNSVPGYGELRVGSSGGSLVTAGAILTAAELASLIYVPPASGAHIGGLLEYLVSDGYVSIPSSVSIDVAESSDPQSLIYFGAATPDREIFALDTNTGAVSLAIDVNDAGSSFPNVQTLIDGKLYFSAVGNNATDGNVGPELYAHDPATGSTQLIADLYVGSGGSNPNIMAEQQGKIYFSAYGNNPTDGAVGQELYVYDANSGSTTLVADLNAASGSSYPGYLATIDDKIYFTATANNAVDGNVGRELYAVDTATDTVNLVADLNAGPGGGDPFYAKELNGKLYFSAVGNNATDGNVGRELYVHDPNTGVTSLVVDLYPGSTPSMSASPNLAVLDGKLYMNASTPSTGYELFVYDPVTDTTSLVADLTDPAVSGGSTGSIFSNMTVLDGKLYFSAYGANSTDGFVGFELYVHDPATGSTSLVEDLSAGSVGSSPYGLTALDGKLYFNALGNNSTDGDVGRELYVHDPATGDTMLVADLWTGSAGSSPNAITAIDDKLYFQAGGNNATDGAVGTELYVHDPATGTTSLVADLNPGSASANPSGMTGAEIPGGSTIVGTGGDDFVVGGPETDVLTGGLGNDTLTGGAGADTFVFNAPAEGVDTIADFVSGTDILQISAADFGGGLTAGDVVTLLTAADAATAIGPGSGYFVYDNAGADTGTVYWDATGGTGNDAIEIAVLQGTPDLHANDIIVV